MRPLKVSCSQLQMLKNKDISRTSQNFKINRHPEC